MNRIIPRYPVGTVLWKMVGKLNGHTGHPEDNKIHWLPEAHAIQAADKAMFMFVNGGASWNSIGKTFFLTREECIAAWGDKPMITDPPEQENAESEDLNEKIIWREDDMAILTITVDKLLVPLSELRWRHNPDYEMQGVPQSGDFLTLQEISDQLTEAIPEHFTGIIEVRIDDVFDGVIYRFGNYDDGKWYKYGELKGYA